MSTSAPSSASAINFLPFFSLSLLVPVSAFLIGGFITRKKSDLKKVDAAVADCEKVLRYILFPCIVLDYFGRADPTKTIFTDAFLQSSSVVFALAFASIFEPVILGLVVQKLLLPSKFVRQNEKYQDFVSLFSTLSLSCQSLAFPIGVTFGVSFFVGKSAVRQQQVKDVFGLDVELLRLMIVFTTVLRAIAQRFCTRFAADTDENSQELKEDSSQSKSKNSFHSAASQLNLFLGGHAAVVICFGVALAFAKFGKTEGGEADGGAASAFVIGVADTLSNAFIPFSSCIEGYHFARAVWKPEEEDDPEKTEQKVEKKFDVVTDYGVIAAHWICRAVISLFVCGFVLGGSYSSSVKHQNANAIICVVVTVLTCSMPYSTEFKLLFKDEEKMRIQGISLQAFCLSAITAPVLLNYLFF